jgi:hypothetical protein
MTEVTEKAPEGASQSLMALGRLVLLAPAGRDDDRIFF